MPPNLKIKIAQNCHPQTCLGNAYLVMQRITPVENLNKVAERSQYKQQVAHPAYDNILSNHPHTDEKEDQCGDVIERHTHERDTDRVPICGVYIVTLVTNQNRLGDFKYDKSRDQID